MTGKVYDFATTVGIVSGLVSDAGLGYTDLNAFGTGLCRYVETQVGEAVRPPCVVGQFFARVGVSETDRAELDRLGSLRNIVANDSTPVLLTERAFQFLDQFQADQDTGKPWGPALLRAIRHATNEDYADTIPTTD